MTREMKAIGVFPLTNFGGIEVFLEDGADHVYWRLNFGEPTRWHRAKIYYSTSQEGRPYFIAYDRKIRVYLDEVMRVNAGGTV